MSKNDIFSKVFFNGPAPNKKILKWANPNREFPKWASPNREFPKWASPNDMDILQKELVQNAHSCVKKELKQFSTPYMQLPPPVVLHDKAKKTQQGNLLD